MPRCSICDRTDFNNDSIFHNGLTEFEDDNEEHVIEIHYDRRTKKYICDECQYYVDDSLSDYVSDEDE